MNDEKVVQDMEDLKHELETDSLRSGIFSTDIGTYQTKRNGLAARVYDAWSDMRASTRRLIGENPSEGRLLFYILLSDMVFFLSWSLKAVVAPTLGARDLLPAEIGIWLIVALFVRTGAIYLFSMVLGLVARIFGGEGSYKDTRAGVFWGSFVAAPFGLLFAMITVLFASLETAIPLLQDEFISQAPYWLSLIPFVYFISGGVAEAHRFKQTFPVFAAMTFTAMILWFFALYMRANGII
ncbi:MAG: YIP1 family protein [Rhodobacteraceae bacterium]|nr:YIP1 family protein [Paracoccaceae bacterium]